MAEIKKPSGEQPEDNTKLIDAIVGSLGALVYDDVQVKDVPTLYQKLGTQSVLNSNINLIVETLQKLSLENIETSLTTIDGNISAMNTELSTGVIYTLLDTNNQILYSLLNSDKKTNEIIFSFTDAKTLNDFILALDNLKITMKVDALKKLFNMFEATKNIADPKNVINSTTTVINFISELGKLDLDPKTIKFLLKNVDKLTELVNSGFTNLVDALIKFDKKAKKLKNINESLECIKTAIEGVNNIMNVIPDLKTIKETLKKIPELIAVIDQLNEVIAKLGSMGKGLKAGFKVLEKSTDKIVDIVNKYNAIDDKAVQKAIDITKGLLFFIIGSALVLIIGGLAMALIDIGNLLMFAGTLLVFTGALIYICKFLIKSQGTLEGGGELLAGLGILVAAAGLVLVIGSLAMKIINIGDLFLFTGTLLVFIISILAVLGIIGEYSDVLNSGGEFMHEFNRLVVISGLLLIIAGLLGNSLDYKAIFKFVAALGLFLLVVGLIYCMVSSLVNEALESAKEFTKLVAVSGLILLLAALVSSLIDFPSLLGFVFSYALFMGSMVFLYIIMDHFIKDSFKGARDFGILILLSGFTLLLGGLIMEYIDWDDLLLFTVMLDAFIAGLLAPFAFYKRRIRMSLRDGKQLGYLVALCGITLLVGGLVMKLIDYGDLILFTLTLDLFIMGVVTPFGIYGKRINKAVRHLKPLMILIVVCAAVLLIGGGLFAAFPEMKVATLWFTGLMLLLLGGVGAICFLLSKIKGSIKKGLLTATLIVVLIGICALAIATLADGVKGCDMLKLWNAVGVMFVIILGIAGFALALGALLMIPFVGQAMLLGLPFMAAMVAILLLVAVSIKEIAEAMFLLSLSGQDLDFGVLISMVEGSVNLAEALSKFAPYGDVMAVVEQASIAMSIALSKISESVEHYASLKVPIYVGTKIVAYRSLTAKDFVSAAVNVSTIITVLGGAIINTYKKNPDMFQIKGAFADLGLGSSPFDMAARSFKVLGPLISSIAEGIQDYAELKMPVYGEGGKIVKYKYLTNKDFDNAANNIGIVITTLAGAIIKTYNQNPAIFYAPPGGLFGHGDSTFDIVCSSLKALGPLISSIADGIKDYADLKFPIAWNEKGEPTKFKVMGNKDFTNAAQNISKVITTLAGALIKTYQDNPTYFIKPPGGLFGSGDSIFDTVCESVGALGPLISNIADGIKDYADLKFPIKWNDKGEAVQFKALGNKDFENAATNIQTVIVTLSQAIIDVYNSKPALFDDGDDSTFNVVVKSCTNLGEMISGIAKGIADYAELKVPIKYDKKGNPVDYKQLGNKDFENAANNIQYIISTVGEAVIGLYNTNPDLFDDGDDSTFNVVLDSCVKMGKMISSISKGVIALASSQIPIEWDKEGKPVKFETLTSQMMEGAADNISYIVTTVGGALIKLYEDHPEMFESGWFSDAPFMVVMESCVKMGKMIDKIGKAVVAYASSQIPIEWDKEGKPVKYQSLTSKTMEDAASGISTIVTTVGGALIKLYEDHPEMFKSGWISDAPFMVVMDSCMKMSKMIKGITDAVIAYGTAQVPIEWDAKGNPTKFQGITPKIMEDAGKGVSDIITTVGNAIIKLYEKHPEMFDKPFLVFDSPFMVVMDSCVKMSKMIKGITDSVIAYGTAKVPIEWDKEGKPTKFEKITPSIMTDAAKGVKAIIETVGGAIIDLYDKRPDMFEEGWFSDSKFVVVLNSCVQMGEMLKAIGESVINYASSNVAYEWDDKGTPIKFKPVDSGMMQDAANGIKAIISTIGNAIIDLYDARPDMFKETLFTDSKFATVMHSVGEMGTMIQNISEAILLYASSGIPNEWNEEGKPINFEPVTVEHMQVAADGIKAVISTIGSAIIELHDMRPDMFEEGWVSDSKFMTVMKSTSMMGKMINDIAQGVLLFAQDDVPQWKNGDAAKSNIPGISALADTAAKVIKKVLTAVGGELMSLYDDYPKWFKVHWWTGKSEFGSIMESCSRMGTMIADIGSGLMSFAKMNLPITDGNGKITGYVDVSGKVLNNAPRIIRDVCTSTARTLYNVARDKHSILNWGMWAVDRAIEACTKMGKFLGNMGKQILGFAVMQVPDQFNPKTGEATHYTQMGPEHFENAANNIKRILGCMVDGFFLPDDQHERMEQILKNGTTLGKAVEVSLQNIKIIADSYKENGASIKAFNSFFDGHGEPLVEALQKLDWILYHIYWTFNSYRYEYDYIQPVINHIYAAEVLLRQFGYFSKELSMQHKKYLSVLYHPRSGLIKNLTYFNDSYSTLRDFIENVSEIFKVTRDNKIYNSDIELTIKLFVALPVMFKSLQKICPSLKHISTYKFRYEEIKQQTIFGYKKLRVIQNIKELIDTITYISESSKKMIKFRIIYSNYKYLPTIFKYILKACGPLKAISIFKFEFESDKTQSFIETNTRIKYIKNIRPIINSILYVGMAAKELRKYNILKSLSSFKILPIMGKYIYGISVLFNKINKFDLDTTTTYVSKGFFGSSKRYEIISNLKPINDSINYIISELLPMLVKNTDVLRKGSYSINYMKKIMLTISLLFNDVFKNVDFSVFESSNKKMSKFDTLITHIEHMLKAFNELNKYKGVSYKFLLIKMIDVYKISIYLNKISNLYYLTNHDNIVAFVNDIEYLNSNIQEYKTSFLPLLINAQYLVGVAKSINQIDDIYTKINPESIPNFINDVFAINTIIDQINQDALDKLATESESLKKYVQSINNLQTYKVDKLINMIDALNKLASNVGSLDEFATKLTNEFGAVVERLTLQVKEAQKTMKDIDNREEERKNKLKEYIEHINEIMGEKLVVEVTQGASASETTDTTSSPSPDLNGEKISDSSSSSGGSGSTLDKYSRSDGNKHKVDNKQGNQTHQPTQKPAPSSGSTISQNDISKYIKSGLQAIFKKGSNNNYTLRLK